MRITTRKKPAFTTMFEAGMFSRVVAVKNKDTLKWSLFGEHRSADAALFVEAARGGIREWSSLDHLGRFCDSMGITFWHVSNKLAEKEFKI